MRRKGNGEENGKTARIRQGITDRQTHEHDHPDKVAGDVKPGTAKGRQGQRERTRRVFSVDKGDNMRIAPHEPLTRKVDYCSTYLARVFLNLTEPLCLLVCSNFPQIFLLNFYACMTLWNSMLVR